MKTLFHFLIFGSLLNRLHGYSATTSSNSEPVTPLCQPSHLKINALPGNGWCSLRNIEMNPVLSITYNDCQVLDTANGKYLIPDHLHITPKSTSDIDTTHEIISSHQDFTSTTATTITASAPAAFGKFSAHASFSSDYQAMKKKIK